MDRRVLMLAAALLTGCANSPTATPGRMPARFDAGGGSFGSGNYMEPGTRPAGRSAGGDGVLTTSDAGTPAVGDSANATGAGRGGGSFGSGN